MPPSCRRCVLVLTAALLPAAIISPAAQAPPAPPADPIPYETRGPSGSRLWGYADASGRLVIPARFDAAKRFTSEGLAEIKRGKLWGMIDRAGNEVIPARNSWQVPLADGLAGVCMDTDTPVPGVSVSGPKPGQRMPVMESKCGYVDRQGKIAIPLSYDWVHQFHDGVASVRVSKKSNVCPAVDFGRATMYGLINTKGVLLLPIDHCYVGPLENGWIRVVYESRGPNEASVGFVDRLGKVVLARLPYDFAGEHWWGDLLPVRTGNQWGVIDRKGHEVLPVRYSSVSISEGLVRASLGGKSGFFDASGKEIVPLKYDDAGDFSDGLACVKVGGKNGFIDRTGKMVIDPRFELFHTCGWRFSEGLRPVPQGQLWGFIDRTGTVVIPPQFDEAWGFSEGVAAVRKGALWGFVDRTGAFAVQPKYFRVDDGFIDGLARVTIRINDPCCPGIYKFASGFLNHHGREYFEAP